MKPTNQLTIPATERNCPAFKAYQDQKRSAQNKRKVPFEISFEHWLYLWLASGHWHERGTKRHQYVMARRGDTGPYKVGNVFFQTVADNAREGNLNSARTYRLVACEHCGADAPANVMWRHLRKCNAANASKT